MDARPSATPPPGFSLFSTSPDGRWEVLLGREEHNDAIHYNALLRARTSGVIYELRSFDAETEDWPSPAPRPLSATGPADAIDLMDPEAQLRWLEGGEVLLVSASLWGTDRSSYFFRMEDGVTRVPGLALHPLVLGKPARAP